MVPTPAPLSATSSASPAANPKSVGLVNPLLGVPVCAGRFPVEPASSTNLMRSDPALTTAAASLDLVGSMTRFLNDSDATTVTDVPDTESSVTVRLNCVVGS